MRKVLKSIVLLSPLLFIACGDGLESPKNETFKGGELLVNFPGAAIKPNLVAAGAVDANATVYGYKAFKIPYTTRDEEGNEVKVSGLFVIPTGLPDIVNSTLGLSMVADDHGTIFANAEAPSVIANSSGAPDGSAIILTSVGGFATVQPDYIGFGDSLDHYHPFMLKDSLANATVDFIKQVKIFAKDNNISLNNQLFLTGYSEGGYASMATLKKIEEEQLSDLTVSLAAPMAGPYALKPLADGVLSQEKLSVPSFMANVGYAYAKANNEEIDTVINTLYSSKLPTLFDGSKTRAEIDPLLSTDTKGATGLFQDTFVADYFSNTNNWFTLAATENNLHTWTPTTSVRLVHCEGDEVIPYAISQLTQGTMSAMGARDVQLVPVESTLGLGTQVGHAACASLAYSVATKMFATVRKQSIGY
ncbi:MAG TPA: hypothetical protein ENK95_03940 [Campylobacterales bacterium]|nr:hypothetical protein [Campylobacterales bacterium]